MRIAYVLGLCVAACVACSNPAPISCGFSVTLDGGIPDAAASDGGLDSGALSIDECRSICGPAVDDCTVAAGSQPVVVDCDPACF